MQHTVRIGVIGAGKFGGVHLATYRQMGWDGEATIAAICRQDAKALHQQTSEYGGAGYTEWRSMLDAESRNLDAVSIVTPDYLHRDMALAAIERGLHVLVEKPLDTTVQGCQQLADAARASGVLLQVDFHKRFDPEHRAVERAVSSGKLGDLLYGYAWMEDRIEVPTRWFPRWACSTSPAWFLGVHFYDLVCWITKSDARRVYATGNKRLLAEEYGVDTYDSISAVVTFSNSATFAFQTSWVLPVEFEAIVNQGMRLIGTKGIWEVDSQMRGSQSCLGGDGMRTWNSNAQCEFEDREGRTRLGGYVIASIESFVRNVRYLKEGGSLEDLAGRYPSGDDATRASRIAQAAHRSLETGQALDLAPEAVQ